MRTQTVQFEYDAERNILHAVDDYEIMTPEDIESFVALYRQQLSKIGRKVHLVTKIDGLFIAAHLDELYGQAARAVAREWILNFARYGETAMARAGMLAAGQKADFVTSVHRTKEEAVAAVLATGGAS